MYKCPNCKETSLIKSQMKAWAYKTKTKEDQYCCPECAWMFLWNGDPSTEPRLDNRWADHRALYKRYLVYNPDPTPEQMESIRINDFRHLTSENFTRSISFARKLVKALAARIKSRPKFCASEHGSRFTMGTALSKRYYTL